MAGSAAKTIITAAAVWACAVTPAFPHSSPPASVQTPAGPERQTDQTDVQILQLRMALDAIREELAGSRRETAVLRQELQAVRDQLESLKHASEQAAARPSAEPSPTEQIEALVEDQELLRAKVDDLEQTKVESGSKHHLRISGLIMLNVAAVSGAVDSLDLPETAVPRLPGDSGGSLGAGARQSRLGLEVFGPTLGGARTTGDMTFDFFGGFPSTGDGVSAPRLRLRTATFTMAWNAASLAAGQDVPFFSPRSPTSLASTAYPALSAAGNLWAWTMQIHVDQRKALSTESALGVQWGILDPLTGEAASEYDRSATAGERSRLPAQAIRVSWQHGADSHLVVVGAGAYHARQDWGFGRTVEAWTTTADWDAPLGRWFAFSGELYRGRAIGGLGGGASDSVLFDGPPTDPASAVWPVETAGGWAQLKIKAGSRLEFNATLGQDNPSRPGLSRLHSSGDGEESAVNRNASGFLNAIVQARSNLLFSVEYRRLWTTGLDEVTRTADHVSVSAGIVF